MTREFCDRCGAEAEIASSTINVAGRVHVDLCKSCLDNFTGERSKMINQWEIEWFGHGPPEPANEKLRRIYS